jgi:hypothetical protein
MAKQRETQRRERKDERVMISIELEIYAESKAHSSVAIAVLAARSVGMTVRFWPFLAIQTSITAC